MDKLEFPGKSRHSSTRATGDTAKGSSRRGLWEYVASVYFIPLWVCSQASDVAPLVSKVSSWKEELNSKQKRIRTIQITLGISASIFFFLNHICLPKESNSYNFTFTFKNFMKVSSFD